MGTFEHAISITLAHEGAYVNDPRDSGGETKFGIAKASYPELDIANLSRDEAIEIYCRDFWQKPGFNQIEHQGISAKLFDMGVNMGPRMAIRFLQKAANKLGADLVVDSLLGPVTLKWINEYRHPYALLMAAKTLAGQYYMALNKPEFLAGWLNRLNS